ncbi:MAG TPA: DUF1707 domain-containing protein [Streptosporangiaceae bacterium]
MPGSGDEPGGTDRGRMRASRTDREQVVEKLKTAYVQERLTEDELDARVGRALAARTYADLDALTADIPLAQPPDLVQSADLGRSAGPAGVRRGNLTWNRSTKTVFKCSIGAIAAITLTVSVVAGVADGAGAAVMVAAFFTIVATIAAGLGASIVMGILTLESRLRKRPGARPPSASGTSPRTYQRPPSASPPRRGSDPALATG